jgi:hypothetical protein
METLKTILLILVITVIFYAFAIYFPFQAKCEDMTFMPTGQLPARCFFQEKDTNIYFKSENSCVAPDNSEEACYLKK